MDAVKQWTVDVYISEHEQQRRTYAEARLRSGDTAELRGSGVARRNPRDLEIPEIGDELAVARALEDLSRRLREVTAGDIEEVTHQPVELDS